MAKLKKFNNQTDYRTFIASSEFSAPDISTINSDVEYNPLSLFHVNAKQLISPTTTNVPFIIDTITNGKVGLWWKPSTGSTYTKVNSIDLIFNSGFTENKITNLIINTKPVTDEYNNIYIVSAVSDTNVSINDTDTCVQYGLITLLGTTFESTGGSKTVQVKTASGNKWKITNVPSWLTFSQTTGEGTTNITVTASEYTSTTTSREGQVTIGYVELDYSTTSGVFVQNKKIEGDFFSFNEKNIRVTDAAGTRNVGYTASGSTIGKTIYLVTSNSGWLNPTSTSITCESTGTITAAIIKNTSRESRNGTITARLNSTTGDVLDTLNVTQDGVPGFIWIEAEGQTAVTKTDVYSATTYTFNILTNYTQADLDSLTKNVTKEWLGIQSFTPTQLVITASTNTSTTERSAAVVISNGPEFLIDAVVVQEGAPSYIWIEADGQTAATRTDVYSATTYTFNILTNYTQDELDSLTKNVTDEWIGIQSFTPTQLVITASTNTSTTERSAAVYILNTTEELIEADVVQQGKNAFRANLRVNNSTSPSNIGSATTTFSISTTPNDTAATYDIVVNGTKMTTTSGNYSGSYSCGANPNTSERTFKVTCEGESVTIKQNPKYVGQTRIVQVDGGGAQWSVNMMPSSVIAGCDVNFKINVTDATGTITGNVYGDEQGITVTTEMNGTIELRTTTLSAFDLTLDLNIESGGPNFVITPYQGNVYGFNSGEIGGGVGGYHTYGTIHIKAGEPDSVTTESLGDMTWELSD